MTVSASSLAAARETATAAQQQLDVLHDFVKHARESYNSGEQLETAMNMLLAGLTHLREVELTLLQEYLEDPVIPEPEPAV